MNYQALTKDRLIGIIKDYQLLTCQLMTEVDRDTGFDAVTNGNLGHWYLNLETDLLTGNPLKFCALGCTDKEILQSVPIQNFLSKIHPDDVPSIIDKLSALREGNTSEYQVEYRIHTGEMEYRRFCDRGRITQYDENGKPLLLSGSTSDVSTSDKTAIENKFCRSDLLGYDSLDLLTKAKNRRSLLKDLGSAAALSVQNGSPFTLTLLRIDDFKEMIESKGPLYGNKVLIDIAELIRQNVGENATFGRYRTDEFMIIFSKIGQEKAAKVLEKIRISVERNGFSDEMTVTIRGAQKEFHGEDLYELIEAVETKLSQDQNNGKNKCAS